MAAKSKVEYRIGDCKLLLKELPDDSIDLIVTDPPYQLDSITKRWGKEYDNTMHFDKSPHHRTIRGFMGHTWDVLPSVEVWKECLRVLKAGAFAFIMCTPRQDSLCTMLNRLSQAGFYMGFTSIYWCYASGFPKALNVSSAIDRQECMKQLKEQLGREPTKEEFKAAWKSFRRVVSESPYKELRGIASNRGKIYGSGLDGSGDFDLTAPATPAAKALDGSYAGFQPKPAVEVIIVAMKPLSKSTYVEQAMKNGHGVTWLDDARIPYESVDEFRKLQDNRMAIRTIRAGEVAKGYGMRPEGFIGSEQSPKGRFPANLVVSDDVLNDGKTWKSGSDVTGDEPSTPTKNVYGELGRVAWRAHGDSGSFSRYFNLDRWWAERVKKLPPEVQKVFPFLIVPKASKSEREHGLEECEAEGERPLKCVHPTVKPIKLFSYLIILGSREGDLVLDPFLGSGTTLIACQLLNRNGMGFEIMQEYEPIIKGRVFGAKKPAQAVAEEAGMMTLDQFGIKV